MPGRIAAMSLAALRPGPLRTEMGLEDLEAVHFPLSVMLPLVSAPPAATTIADVQHEEHPEFFGRAELAYRKAAYGWTIRRSRIVIAVSEHARTTLAERYGLGHDRIRVIPHGIDHEVFTPGDTVSHGSYLLYPARPWRHKNHALLFEAFARVRTTRPELELVLTGEG